MTSSCSLVLLLNDIFAYVPGSHLDKSHQQVSDGEAGVAVRTEHHPLCRAARGDVSGPHRLRHQLRVLQHRLRPT